MTSVEKHLEKILPFVEKPGRYIGGELHSVIKSQEEVTTHFGFAFPDTYEIGMSYLGLQIIYKILNDRRGVYCERIFAPAIDMEEQMRKAGLPLFTIETKTPVKELDMLGFTLQYELCYTNILNMLDLAGIPLKSAERNGTHPFVVGGGPCAFNPEPIADFFDFFIIGDGEEILDEILDAHRQWKGSGGNRNEFMSTISKLTGIYVPSYYEPIYAEDMTLDRMEKKEPSSPSTIRKNIVASMDNAPFPTDPIVPFIEVVHDRAVLELFRGCTRGCRFCQAGMIYRPVRERSVDCAVDLINKQLALTGHDELSLLSLSTSDYSEFEKISMELIKTGNEKNVAISLPSLRLDSFSFKVLDEIQKYKKTGLTFAPEAGTQRLRDVINKNITDDNIYDSIKQAIEMGWNSVKLYFMIGLPTETLDDLDGIIKIASNIMKLYYENKGTRKGGKFKVTVSVSNFVPKPHTPFQWFSQDNPDILRKKHYYLKDKLKKIKGVQFNYHDTGSSEIEAVLARGDRRLSQAIYNAWTAGCKFDGWREHFKYDTWKKAIIDAKLDPVFYTSGKVSRGKVLPWGIIDSGVTEDYLQSEWDKSIIGELTPDCRSGCTGCGVNRYSDCKKKEAK